MEKRDYKYFLTIIFVYSVAKLMENYESLDALVAPKTAKEQLLFDLSSYKSSNDVGSSF